MKKPRSIIPLHPPEVQPSAPPPPTASPPPDPHRLARLPEILAMLGIKKSTWWKWNQEGKTPPAIRLGRVTAWKYVDVVKLAQEGLSHG